MTLRDFRIGWRLLLKEPGYSLAVVLGLAVGFAVCFLLLGFVRYCFTYNAAIPDSEHIFVVKERRNLLPRPDWRATAPPPLRDVAATSGPQLSATSAKSFDLAARIDNRVVPLTLQVADANFLDFFGVRAIEGDAAAALARPDALVLSQSQARKLFGHAACARQARCRSTACRSRCARSLPTCRPTPASASMRWSAPAQHSWDPPPTRAGADWFRARQRVCQGAAPGVDPAGLAALLQDAVARERDAKMTCGVRARLPGRALDRYRHHAPVGHLLRSATCWPGAPARSTATRPASPGWPRWRLLILLLASANYVNLATVRTLGRQREIAIRKVLGVSGARLAGQFVAESLVVSMLATLCGLLLAWLAMPLFATLVNRPLSGFFSAASCAAMLALGALVGLAVGAVPGVAGARASRPAPASRAAATAKRATA